MDILTFQVFQCLLYASSSISYLFFYLLVLWTNLPNTTEPSSLTIIKILSLVFMLTLTLKLVFQKNPLFLYFQLSSCF